MCLADISIIFAPKIEKKGRKTMRLSELNTGEKGVIVKVLGHGVSANGLWKWDLLKVKQWRSC